MSDNQTTTTPRAVSHNDAWIPSAPYVGGPLDGKVAQPLYRKSGGVHPLYRTADGKTVRGGNTPPSEHYILSGPQWPAVYSWTEKPTDTYYSNVTERREERRADGYDLDRGQSDLAVDLMDEAYEIGCARCGHPARIAVGYFEDAGPEPAAWCAYQKPIEERSARDFCSCNEVLAGREATYWCTHCAETVAPGLVVAVAKQDQAIEDYRGRRRNGFEDGSDAMEGALADIRAANVRLIELTAPALDAMGMDEPTKKLALDSLGFIVLDVSTDCTSRFISPSEITNA